jgi:hypothetical protein
MRTTLNLPDDVHHIVSAFADARGLSLGEAVAELVRKGLRQGISAGSGSAFPCFIVPEDARLITLTETLTAEDAV